jgi:hypothetical protein
MELIEQVTVPEVRRVEAHPPTPPTKEALDWPASP